MCRWTQKQLTTRELRAGIPLRDLLVCDQKITDQDYLDRALINVNREEPYRLQPEKPLPSSNPLNLAPAIGIPEVGLAMIGAGLALVAWQLLRKKQPTQKPTE